MKSTNVQRKQLPKQTFSLFLDTRTSAVDFTFIGNTTFLPCVLFTVEGGSLTAEFGAQTAKVFPGLSRPIAASAGKCVNLLLAPLRELLFPPLIFDRWSFWGLSTLLPWAANARPKKCNRWQYSSPVRNLPIFSVVDPHQSSKLAGSASARFRCFRLGLVCGLSYEMCSAHFLLNSIQTIKEWNTPEYMGFFCII